MNYDSNGLIVQLDGDGGDTAGREGDYWFFVGVNKYFCSRNFKDVLFMLQVNAGEFVRNPVHYNDPKDFSRDQTVPLILAMGEMKEYNILKLVFWKQVKRFGAYQNFSVKWSKELPDNDERYKKILGRIWVKGDIGSPEDFGYYIRAFRWGWLYPVLLVSDIQLLMNSFIRVIRGSDTNTSDDINHTLGLIQAQNIYATPISWVARLVYKWLRRGGVQRAWDNYFDPRTNANSFNEMYRPLIRNM